MNEWEDIFSELLNAPLYYDNWKKRDKTIFWKLPWLASFFQTNDSITGKITLDQDLLNAYPISEIAGVYSGYMVFFSSVESK